MQHKLIMENWRNFIKESAAENIIMQLDGLLSLDEELDGPMVKRIFKRGKKLALKSIDLQANFPKVMYGRGTGSAKSRYTSWATYYGRPNTIIVWLGTWSQFDKKFKNFLKNIIEVLLEQKHKDNIQQMSTPDVQNITKDKDIKKIKSLLLDAAAVILSFTIVHELEHANQMYIYGGDNWDNPSYTAAYEYDSVELESTHLLEIAEPAMDKIAKQLAYQVYLILLDFGVEQEDMENIYHNIIDFLKKEIDDIGNKIDKDRDYYEVEKVPSEKEIESDEKYVPLYTVQRGDSLYKIAKKFKVDFRDILKLNRQLKDPNKIYVGQRIRVPNAQDLPAPLPGRDEVRPEFPVARASDQESPRPKTRGRG